MLDIALFGFAGICFWAAWITSNERGFTEPFLIQIGFLLASYFVGCFLLYEIISFKKMIKI
jgi:hypothetical protein